MSENTETTEQPEHLSERDLNILLDRALKDGRQFNHLEILNLESAGDFEAMEEVVSQRMEQLFEGDKSPLTAIQDIHRNKLMAEMHSGNQEWQDTESDFAFETRMAGTKAYKTSLPRYTESYKKNPKLKNLLRLQSQLWEARFKAQNKGQKAFYEATNAEFGNEIHVFAADRFEEPTFDNWGRIMVPMRGPWNLERAMDFVEEHAEESRQIFSRIKLLGVNILLDDELEETNFQISIPTYNPNGHSQSQGPQITPNDCVDRAKELRGLLLVSDLTPAALVSIHLSNDNEVQTGDHGTIFVDVRKSAKENMAYILGHAHEVAKEAAA